MMPGNVFRLQLAAAFIDRRRIVLRMGVSVLLALPFIFVGLVLLAVAVYIVTVAGLKRDKMLAESGLKPFVYVQPWNSDRHELPSVRNWQEILDLLAVN